MSEKRASRLPDPRCRDTAMGTVCAPPRAEQSAHLRSGSGAGGVRPVSSKPYVTSEVDQALSTGRSPDVVPTTILVMLMVFSVQSFHLACVRRRYSSLRRS